MYQRTVRATRPSPANSHNKNIQRHAKWWYQQRNVRVSRSRHGHHHDFLQNGDKTTMYVYDSILNDDTSADAPSKE